MKARLGLVILMGIVAQHARAQIVVTSIDPGDPGSLVLDVNISSAGAASTPATDFTATGSTAKSGAFGGTIGIFLDAMNIVDLNPSTLGNKLDDGVFNRAGDGKIGVNGVPNGGINDREGIILFLDELTGIDPSLAVQLTSIELAFMAEGKTCVVMNPLTKQAKTLTTSGDKDVSELNLWIQGGEYGAVAVIFGEMFTGDSTSGFRVAGFTFDVVERDVSRPEIVVSSTGAGGSPGSTLGFDLDIDASGNSSVASGEFAATGFTAVSNAFNGSVSVMVDAIKDVSIAAGTLGEKLVDGIVNRDSTSAMGVEGDPGGNGIAYVDSGYHEGLSIAFDELAGIDPSVRVQITRIGLTWLRRNEPCRVVNLETGASREYWGTIPTYSGYGSDPVDIDVSDLNLGCWGGETGKVATIFAQSDNSNFRVKTFTFEIKQGGPIEVSSTSSSDPGSTLGLDLVVGDAGGAAATNIGMMATGVTPQTGAFGGMIGLVFDAMKNVSTDSSTLGDKLMDGNIARDSRGRIGVDGDPNGGGIGRDGANIEGLALIFNQLSGFDPSLQVKFTKIKVGFLGDDESFSVVNLATRNDQDFAGSGSTYPEYEFDISSLGIKTAVGSSSPIVSIFAGDGSSFNVISVTLEMVGAGGLPMEATISVVDASTVQLVWESIPGASYKIEHTPDLVATPFEDLSGHVGIPSGGASTTNQINVSGESQSFYKVISE